MIRFLAPLDIRLLHKEDAEGLSRWRLLNGIAVVHERPDGGDTRYVIPAQFKSNGASLPRPLRAVWNPIGPDVAKAAFFHDWLYQNRGCARVLHTSRENPGIGRVEEVRLTRRECDRLLYLSMRSLGAGRVKSTLFYLGVRVGGGGHFYA